MKKITTFILLLFMFCATVNAETIYELPNTDTICNSVKADTMEVFIYDYYGNQNVEVAKATNSCSNTTHYNNNLKTLTEGQAYTSWTWHGRVDNSARFFVEGVEKTKKEYQAFVISNHHQAYTAADNTLNRLYTLKSGEKIFFTIDLGDKAFSSNQYQDLRLSIDSGQISSDTSIIARNSIGYYLIDSNNNEYGPYRLEYYETKEMVNQLSSTGSYSRVTIYNLISENLLTNNLPKNITIQKIKVVPYDFYNTHAGYVRLYSISLNGYNSTFTKTTQTVNLNNAQSTIRKNITDNMLKISTLKWEIAADNTTELNFYHHYNSSNPQQYNATTGMVYYGIPYVNSYNSTIESFLDNTVPATKDNKMIYDYYLPTKYTTTVTSTIGNTITAGDPFPNNKLYVYEANVNNDNKGKRKTNLATYDYIKNSSYFFGLDCSSSTYLAESTEIPIVVSMALSNRYSTSAEVDIIGDAVLDNKNFEKYLRDSGTLGSTDNLTDDTFNDYYSQYFKLTNTDQTIYESYALAIPGDIIAKRGHVRMESGYPFVKCNDGTTTQRYTKGFCDNHNGINPTDSYVITSEIGGTYATPANKSAKYNGVSMTRADIFVREADTGWSFSVDSNYTDITSVDDFLNIKSNYIVNSKYSFQDLYGADVNEEEEEVAAESGMYMAFRYKSMNNPANNKVEIPIAKTIALSDRKDLVETKELKGTLIANYIIQEIKYEINGESYIVHPKQVTLYSLYYDTPANIKEAIQALDVNDMEVKVSIKMGPNNNTVQAAAHSDENNYIEILHISTKELEAVQLPLNEMHETYLGDVLGEELFYTSLTANQKTRVYISEYDNLKSTGFAISVCGESENECNSNIPGTSLIKDPTRNQYYYEFTPTNSEYYYVQLYEDKTGIIEYAIGIYQSGTTKEDVLDIVDAIVANSSADKPPVFRLYNPNNGEHLYTTDSNEVKVLYKDHGWGYEGVGWYTPTTGTPVYRLYNPGLGNHLYTSNMEEFSILTEQYGWLRDNDSKPVMYSTGNEEDTPIYRLYNKALSGMHHLTTDLNEYNALKDYGWDQEGVSMYAQEIGEPTTTEYYHVCF